MPELPEVEVLVRHLRPLLRNKSIRGTSVRRARVLRPTTVRAFQRALVGAKFRRLSRRGKYLVFELVRPRGGAATILLGHLGMTGRMFVAPRRAVLPQHTAIVLDLGKGQFVYEDTRYFGRLTLDTSAIGELGPEPLSSAFDKERFGRALKRSQQAIKVKLLDQSLVAGIGNIYASEALFRARLSPRLPARKLTAAQVGHLWGAIRKVLLQAIRYGSTVPLSYDGEGSDGLFYFGRTSGEPDFYEERLLVYDREGRLCPRCGVAIKRIVQAARSTFFCPRCQRR